MLEERHSLLALTCANVDGPPRKEKEETRNELPYDLHTNGTIQLDRKNISLVRVVVKSMSRKCINI